MIQMDTTPATPRTTTGRRRHRTATLNPSTAATAGTYWSAENGSRSRLAENGKYSGYGHAQVDVNETTLGRLARTCVHAQSSMPAAAKRSLKTEPVNVNAAGTTHHRLSSSASGTPASRNRRTRRGAGGPCTAQASSAQTATHAITSARCGGFRRTKPQASDAS